MGFMMDQLREKLKKKQDSNSDNVVKKFKRVPLKDITFISAESTPEDITNYVNSRTQTLINECGGVDRYVDGDFSVKYVDKSSKRDFVKKTVHDVEDYKSKEAGTYDEYDWEAKESVESIELKEGLNKDDIQFYMIVIEYTKIIELQ